MKKYVWVVLFVVLAAFIATRIAENHSPAGVAVAVMSNPLYQGPGGN